VRTGFKADLVVFDERRGEASDADGGDRSSGQGFLAGCGAAPVRDNTPRV
jgi:hypothetical protein